MKPPRDARWTVLRRPGPGALRNLADTLRQESWGAGLLLAGALVALVWANSPWGESYRALAATPAGPSWGHLDLTAAEWAKDGLLTVFFFTVGLELKREMVVGQLRRFSTAVVPVVAAVGGMAAPALVYAAVNAAQPGGSMQCWAIPVATDIAFAVAVLGAFGRGLPTALRAFLLTLAVADDLLGIIVIAVFYSDGINLWWLAGAGAAVAVYAALVRLRRPSGPALFLLGLAAWYCMHRCGVHATIAGVLLGFATPALPTKRRRPGERVARAERYEHLWRPVSAGLAVPLFALFAAGVELNPAALAQAASDPAAQGVFAGLVVGKPVGIFLTTWALVKFSRAALDAAIRWADLLAVAAVGGIGFTVSLLIGELAFPGGSAHEAAVKAGILFGSLGAAVLGAILLQTGARWHRRHASLAYTEEAAVDEADLDLTRPDED
ncbi:MAG: Na+/H+ antiporter NhaA [Bifidobacteriaceae bacterium]|jgi:NhaA family Na+:H+ antiporter|nr:Na+/H+ antiporter NhaA [Bifidobacteriaceae bacterium]